MSRARFAAALGAAFVVSQIAAVLVHGLLLDADYAPFRGTLLRADAGAAMLLLPVAHLSFVTALVWVYSRLGLRGALVARGAKLGVLGWLIGQAPLWMLWYAQQPWPGALVVKQLLLELASSIAIGIAIAVVARIADPGAAVRARVTVLLARGSRALSLQHLRKALFLCRDVREITRAIDERVRVARIALLQRLVLRGEAVEEPMRAEKHVDG